MRGGACPRQKDRTERASGQSGGLPMVIPEQATEPLATNNGSIRLSDLRSSLQNPMLKSLVVSLPVIMRQKITCGLTQRVLTEEYHASQRFGFQRKEKTLEERVAVRALRRQQHQLQIGGSQDGLELRGELRVAIK